MNVIKNIINSWVLIFTHQLILTVSCQHEGFFETSSTYVFNNNYFYRNQKALQHKVTQKDPRSTDLL